MEAVFLKILNMSITASWLVLAIILLRFILNKAPKAIVIFLWALVAVRLICPFSFESVFSLIPSAETVPENIVDLKTPTIQSGIPVVNETVNPIISESLKTEDETEFNLVQSITYIASIVWIVGVIVMLLYTAISYLHIYVKVREAAHVKGKVWMCDHIDAPFIFGVFCPRIYIPSGISDVDRKYVVAHEKAHIKRHDHWWKPFGFMLLSVYWFNPVLWIAYILLCRDIELACDEKVIKDRGIEIKKPYSEALINCSVPRRMVAACPLAFGEVGVRGRIKSVLNYKKPAFWIMIVAVIASMAVAICFMTNPISSKGVLNRVIHEKGYSIVKQEEDVVTLSIPKSLLPESIYSKEGYEFSEDEVIAYKDDTTTIYLKEAMLSNEGNDNLYFCFDYTYNLPRDSGMFLYPYKVNENSFLSEVLVKDRVLRTENAEYTDAIDYRGTGPETLILFYVSTEALKKAEGTISFDICLNSITYLKDGVDSSIIKDIKPVTDETLDNGQTSDNTLKNVNHNSYVCPVDGTGDNYQKMIDIGAIPNSLATVKITSVNELQSFMNKMESTMCFDNSYSDTHSFIDVSKEYTDDFFEDRTLFLIYAYAGTSANRFYVDYVYKTNNELQFGIMEYKPSAGDCVMQGWLICVSVPNEEIEDIADINARISVCYTPDVNGESAEMIAIYTFKKSEDLFDEARIILYDNETFQFHFSLLSSYIGRGKFTAKNNRLTLNTSDGLYTYCFDVVNNTLVFDVEASSKNVWSSEIKDGCIFER